MSFTTTDLTGERLFSCFDCGNEWNNPVEVDSPKTSRWSFFLELNKLKNK
jgi:hypothetical protein